MNLRSLRLPTLCCFWLGPLCLSAPAAILRVSHQAPGPVVDGQTWQTAFLTIPDAIAAAALGDEIWVAAGTYGEGVTIPYDMSLYGGFAGNETARSQRDPSLNPTNLSPPVFRKLAVESSVGPASVIDGFIFGARFPVWLYGGSPTISHNYFNGTSPGVGADSNYPDSSARVLFNTFSGPPGVPGAYAIFIGGGNPFVQGNAVIGASIWCGYGNPNAGPASPIVVGNYVASRNYALLVGGHSAIVADNVVFGATLDAHGLNATVVNNVVVGSSGNGLSFRDLLGDCVVANNIVAFNRYGMVPFMGTAQDAPLTLFNNCVYGNTYDYPPSWKSPFGFQGNISVDPQFVNRNGDFHLAATSPLIDAGNDAYFPYDYPDLDGHPRVQGSHVDIGAYEFGGSAITMGDVAGALRLWGGLSAATPELVARLNVETGAGVDLQDAVRLARKATGLE